MPKNRRGKHCCVPSDYTPAVPTTTKLDIEVVQGCRNFKENWKGNNILANCVEQ